MLLNFELGLITLVLLILHFALKISIIFSIIAFAVWLGKALVVVFVIGWAYSGAQAPVKTKRNVNPYSASSSQYLNKGGKVQNKKSDNVPVADNSLTNNDLSVIIKNEQTDNE